MRLTIKSLRSIVREEVARSARLIAESRIEDIARQLLDMDQVAFEKAVGMLLVLTSDDFMADNPQFSTVEDVVAEVDVDSNALDELLVAIEESEPEVLNQFEQWLKVKRPTMWARGRHSY